MERLKPCPFCGGTHPFVSKTVTNFYAEQFCVICEDCGGRSKYTTNSEKATKAWNRRVNDGD